MIRTKPFFCNILLLLTGFSSFSQQLDTNNIIQNLKSSTQFNNSVALNDATVTVGDSLHYNTPLFLDSPYQKKNTATYPPSNRDYRRLSYGTAMIFGAAIISFGILYVMPESVTGWDKQAMKENGIAHKWKENVKAGPIWDHDSWVFNYVMHPYCGGLYYMTARSSGFNIFESFLYSVFMSTCFWEYGVEAFAEIPSKQDLVVTPIAGSVMGEGFFYAKKSILKNDKRILHSKFFGYTTLFLIDPINTLLDSFGYKEKIKSQSNLVPIGFDKGTNKTIWGLNFSMQF